jgi:uncharacterized protein involved in response to NO
MFWHGHEMIWGYACAIMVGFLHTAVANWTGRPPLQGLELAVLVLLWLAARIAAVTPAFPGWIEMALTTTFLLLAAFWMARSIIRVQQRRNYFVPLLLVAMAASHLVVHMALRGMFALDARALLHSGVLIVAATIFFMGMRVIPFFTSRALLIPQVETPRWVVLTVIHAPLLMALALMLNLARPWLLEAIALLGMATTALNLWTLWRWRPRRGFKALLAHPMLWVLHAGYACTALGVGLYGLALAVWPAGLSAALHCITVGGIGLLTLGMMTRTALGHTGRALVLPRSMVWAYGLLLAATVLRVLAALLPALGWTAFYTPGLHTAALCFALAFGLFLWRYGPWLLRPRADGRK